MASCGKITQTETKSKFEYISILDTITIYIFKSRLYYIVFGDVTPVITIVMHSVTREATLCYPLSF